ncbi:RecB family exonuclease [Serratia ficaria]|uniref:CRISPR-associated protein Cas4 n=1 Tax=Serratia ficaria TaxID=61651 RepID=A0A240C5K8_SERFI|nr:PD-(D/E)XK nuclease family protein [Serratia ficaria]REF43956.1 PD-(D/E)XK nuclease superfamily protein [Serratia ficaria]CAI0725304.1 CRISPR-associated protein Cas4 [Serratia ficaria]CAI0743209.1 CRISPR-associated protein Cas4 [Serratia ficaria]CAI0754285.1 CRISPR-associated protein Cas4 [Serratia ficaria]CAI1937964.1 CRISPR-associated protein Cas4 [Serratia ficaria]
MNAITLTRTRPAIPSKLGVFIACPARYLLESELHTTHQVSLHPRTILGSVVHWLANTLQKNLDGTPASFVELLESSFISALRNTKRAGPITEWVLQHYGISGIISRQTLLEQVRYAKSITKPFVERGKYSPIRLEKQEGIIPFGREKILSSSKFNMIGRADLIYQTDSGSIRVVDFKTGKVLDETNQPKDHYFLQIAAYGMMVKEQIPDVDIELELAGASDSWLGHLDKILNDRLIHILSKLNNTLPLNKTFYAEALVQTGKHCVTCISRCSCPVYREKLQQHLQQHQFGPTFSDYDIIGRLLDVEEGDSLITLRVQLANGYTIKVFRIPSQIFPESERIVGRLLSMYGLNRLGRSAEGSFPRNFYVIDTQDPKRSAFQFFLQWK